MSSVPNDRHHCQASNANNLTQRLETRRPILSKDPDDIWTSLRDEGPDAGEARWKSIHFAIHSLPHDQPFAIELAYYQGFSQSETAAELIRNCCLYPARNEPD